ncbi:sigma factor-like helix-turn-helix DNA-binding protein [Streptomyces tendae]|uniref:sigma factor-like helix-turn-helix DNA-binding protein n=1 Tax=Streptomyces tendae TaxID=1932 RepID=UPI003443981F
MERALELECHWFEGSRLRPGPSDACDLRRTGGTVARLVDDCRRRTTRRREADPAWPFDAVPAQSDDIDGMLDSVLLEEAFRSLSRKHREVIYESYYSDRSTREVAVALGIPPGTVGNDRTVPVVNRPVSRRRIAGQSADVRVGHRHWRVTETPRACRSPSGESPALRPTAAVA